MSERAFSLVNTVSQVRTLFIQSVISGPLALGSPGNLLETFKSDSLTCSLDTRKVAKCYFALNCANMVRDHHRSALYLIHAPLTCAKENK